MIWLKLGAAAIVVGLLAWLGVIVNGWKTDAAQVPVLEERIEQAKADRDAQIEAAKKSSAAVFVAEAKAAEASKAARKVQVVYREANREDPDCAAWASAPVMCPLGGVRIDTAAAPGNLPGDSAKPDP